MTEPMLDAENKPAKSLASPPVDARTRTIAADIARQLDETNPVALEQIERIVQRLGVDAAHNFLREALECEAKGGLMVRDGSRRRTLGGVFLHLVRQQVSRKDMWIIWPHLAPKPAPPPPPPLTWEERLELIPQLLPEKGEATTVKITLIGRPGRIVEKGDVVLTSMQSTKTPSLPKGLPTPPSDPTTYVVFIARKQWQKVAQSIQDPKDILIVEGYPVFDKRLGAMSVFAMNVTTKLLQAAKREGQAKQR